MVDVEIYNENEAEEETINSMELVKILDELSCLAEGGTVAPSDIPEGLLTIFSDSDVTKENAEIVEEILETAVYLRTAYDRGRLPGEFIEESLAICEGIDILESYLANGKKAFK